MSEHTDFERELVQRLADGAPTAAPGALERAKLAIVNVPQRRGLIRLTSATGSVPWMQAAAAVAVVVAAFVVGYALGRLSPRVGDGPSPSPSPSPSAAAIHPSPCPSAAAIHPSPSASAGAILWTSDRAQRDWPVSVRSEPCEPILTTLAPAASPFEDVALDAPSITDATGDVGASVPGWLDITKVRVVFNPTGDPITGELILGDRVEFVDIEVASQAPFDFPHPRELWVAYGLVVDVDDDGQPDLRLGMDNAPEGIHRAWVTDLATGVTAAMTGPGTVAVGPIIWDTWLPGETHGFGRMLPNPEELGAFKFYVWASLIEDGRVVATDFAPDAGWVDPIPPATPVQRVDHDDAWPGEVRNEPLHPTGVVTPFRDLEREQLIYRDPMGDVIGAPPWADLTLIEVQAAATGATGSVPVRFELAAAREVLESIAAYGVVVDVDGDGLPDFRIGMDNRDGERHREWISDLSTGRADINDGGFYGWAAFGMFTDTYFPGQEDPANAGHLLATLGARGVRFYVWASAIDADGTVYTDYTPNVGWIEFYPNRLCEPGCADPSAPPAPGG